MKKAITLIVLGILFLSGCNNEAPQLTAQVAVNADTILDQQIFESAVSAKDAKACERIKDEAMKGECRDVTNALVLTEQAVAKLDKGLCGKIKLSRYEEECGNQVNNLKEIAKKDEDNKKQLEVFELIGEQASEQKDATKCKEIENKEIKNNCIYNITVSQAIEKKDSNICNSIEDTYYKELCLSMSK